MKNSALSHRKTKRNVEIDIIKTILIFLVVVGHVINYLYTDSSSTNSIHKIIYSFHMPFFILISGYLTAFKKDNEIADKRFIKNRISRLFIPYLIWNIFECILTKKINIFYVMFMKPVLWFLFVLFLYETVIHISSKYKNKIIPIVLFYVFAISLLIFFKKSSDILVAFIIYYPFWIFGFLFNRYKDNRIMKFIYKKSWWALLLYPLSMLLYTYDQYETVVPYIAGLLQNKIPSILIYAAYNVYNRYIVAPLGILFLLSIVKFTIPRLNKNLCNKIATIGKYTIYIYILEKWFEFQIFNNVYADGIILIIAKFFVPIIIALIVKHFKYINRLLFGEK